MRSISDGLADEFTLFVTSPFSQGALLVCCLVLLICWARGKGW